MKLSKFLELFFVITAGMAMPFIIIGSYFNLVPREQRSRSLTIFFLIISIIYALTHTYFFWKDFKESGKWEKITEEKKGRK